MKRGQLEHILRASAAITGADQIVVIGSEADPWTDRSPPARTDEVHRGRRVHTGSATGLCLEAHDLAIAKLVAGRDKDTVFVEDLLRHGLIDAALLRERLAHTDLQPAVRDACHIKLQRLSPTK